MYQLDFNKIITGNNVEVLRDLPGKIVDLTVTSPPYDWMRSYKGQIDKNNDFNGYSFDFEGMARELYRVTKPGGVVIWNVDDSYGDSGRTGNPERMVCFFKSLGFWLHQRTVWEKPGCAFPRANRYVENIEPVYFFSKGKPKTAHV